MINNTNNCEIFITFGAKNNPQIPHQNVQKIFDFFYSVLRLPIFIFSTEED